MFAGIKTSAKYPNSAAVKEGRFNNRDAYQRDYDSSVTGFGRKEREDDEFNPEYDDRMRRETGMIFYNVTDPAKAQELGLKQTRTGKWYIRTGNRLAQQIADKAFGPGKIWYPKNESVDEVAPPGAKAERMVKHIKAGYAKDGKLTDKEKAIAYATAWKAHNAGKVEEEGMAEASPETTFNVLKGLKTWQVVIFNNYYAGKYSDYRGRFYYVLAHSPEEAKQVVIDNADGILQELLAMRGHNGKKILPSSKAVPITSGRIGKIEDGTVAGRMSTAGFKKMFGPQGPMMVKLSGGNVVDIQSEEQGVAEGALNEFAVEPSDGDSDDEYDLLVKLVKLWWLGNAQQHAKAEKTLASMGISIDEDEPNIILRRGTQFLTFPMDDFQQGVAEEKTRLDPKCWTGYKKQGTKMKGGVRVNNCVPVNEGEANLEKALEKLHGNWSGWYPDDYQSDPDVKSYWFDDGEGGFYADGTIEHNLKTGEIKVDFKDKEGSYGDDVQGTFNSVGEVMNALRGGSPSRRNTKAPNLDTLGHREPIGPDDLYKTDKKGKIGTIKKVRSDTMKASSPYRMRGGPKGVLPEGEIAEDKLANDLYRDLQIFKKGTDKGISSKAKDKDIGSKPQDKDIVAKEDWQKVNKSDKTDGMSDKAVKAYRRENPGSKLKTAVTTKPSKLKAGSKAANRRKSFCARMSGVEGPMKDEKGRPTAKAKALKRWNC
jgi:hypothetical protein